MISRRAFFLGSAAVVTLATGAALPVVQVIGVDPAYGPDVAGQVIYFVNRYFWISELQEISFSRLCEEGTWS
jgi:hypothetical protein